MIRLKLSSKWCRSASLKINPVELQGKMDNYNLLKGLVH